MGFSAITQYVDVAQLVLYMFWAFFAGLIYYLVRENHREGYPMETVNGRGNITGWPQPRPKTYLLRDGGTLQTPNGKLSGQTLNADPAHRYAGSPLVPTGDNPLLAGVGPGSWADRADVPDRTADGETIIQPLRKAHEFGVHAKNMDPRGLPVTGADGEVGGTVVDMWVDTEELLFRYIEVQVAGGARNVLLPINFARIRRSGVEVGAILARQFADVPGTRDPDVVTLLEEEKIMAYYGAGSLYATPDRQEPLV